VLASTCFVIIVVAEEEPFSGMSLATPCASYQNAEFGPVLWRDLGVCGGAMAAAD